MFNSLLVSMIRDLESNADKPRPASSEVFPDLRRLFRNRLFQASGVLVIAVTALLHTKNHQPAYRPSPVNPNFQKKLRKILDCLQDEDQPLRFQPNKKKNPLIPGMQDTDLNETVIG